MFGVPCAFLAAGGAGVNARLKQRAHYSVVPLARPRKNPCRDITDVRTRLTARDAGAHRTDVLFDEI
jgi:hypothetical protein